MNVRVQPHYKGKGIVILAVFVTFIITAVIATPLTFAERNMWNDAYGRNSSRYESANRKRTPPPARTQSTKTSRPSTVVTQQPSPSTPIPLPQPEPSATIPVVSQGSSSSNAIAVPPIDTSAEVQHLATEQSHTQTLPVSYDSKKMDASLARSVVMAGTVSAIVGGMLITFTYLPFMKRYSTVGISVTR